MHDRDRGLSTLRTVEVPLVENDNQAVDTQPAATGRETRRSERSSRSYQGRSGGRGGRSDDRGGRSDDRGGRSDDRGDRSDDRGDRSDDRGGRSDDRGRGSQDRRRQRPTGSRRGKVCTFCADKISVIDYKDVGLLRNFVSEHGKIKARRRTGTCAKHQRRLALAIKRARHLAFLPYSAEHARGR